MLSDSVIIASALAYMGVLFGIAYYGDYRADTGRSIIANPYIYTLSLAIYCTAWTFYGSVGLAAKSGVDFLPVYLGPTLMAILFWFVLRRIVRITKVHRITSIADFVASRYGKSGLLAGMVTVIVVLGILPYIAIQLKAIASSFSLLRQYPVVSMATPAPHPVWADTTFYVALVLTLFAILFGTRHIDNTERHEGMVAAVAFESLFKLVAMLALGAFVWFGLAGLPAIEAPPPVATSSGGFMPLVLLGAMAMFIMPHQFHVGVVECRDDRDIRTARWLFPLYLLLIAIPALPLARAGAALLGDRVPSDMYALALPLAAGSDGIALLVFLGGLSAATGMVIVSTLTLSLMIGNHWFAPGLLRGAWSRGRADDHRGGLLLLRRGGIVVIMLLGWAYARLVSGNEALADVGAVSFSALATLTPALAFAVWRPQTPARAAVAGVVAAFAAWAWVMLVPMLGAGHAWAQQGPWGQAWLAPESLFGLTGWSRLGRAVGVSLFIGTITTLLVAGLRSAPHRGEARGSDLRTLRNAGRRFLPAQRVDELLRGAPPSGPVPAAIELGLERELAAVLGSASARLLLDAARREAGPDLDTVAAIVGEASQDLRFNQRLLEAALENMSQGISVVDSELRLVAWNARYAQLFGFPPAMLRVGMPVEDLVRHNLRQGLIGPVDIEFESAKRLRHMRTGTPYVAERRFPDGTVVEIRGNPMPNGGFVATFTDVTAFRDTEAELKRSNETLELRVAERTDSLDQARREAERANDAKGRFLAAVGHDLLQPLHAAQLFTDSLAKQLDTERRRSLQQIRGALDSTTDLLTGLFDMSRLEAGGLVPQPRDFPLAEVLDPLASEFRALAEERGLTFRNVPTAAWVHGDPQLLRRVLQNFLANAVRYTREGGVLLGVRHDGDGLRIEVHDTGPGIEPSQQALIFEEFRRGEGVPGQGLGLGLAIADRVAKLMHAPLGLRSEPGRGTVFSLRLPRAPAAGRPDPVAGKPGLAGKRLLIVDNDSAAIDALRALLQGWGCSVDAAADGEGARMHLQRQPAALWLFDYHLDDGDTGIALHTRLVEEFEPRPTLILSADDSGDVRRAALEHGLSLLQKPVRPLALKSVLDRMLASRL
ncbi:MAG: PAS-domain containing protein [Luteimonas sp.]|nr:PAS-domain containing protein [Luteimonas sp.]